MTSRGGLEKGFVVGDAILKRYYPKVLTLRAYLLSKLPKKSKVRQRKLACLGYDEYKSEDGNAYGMVQCLAEHLDKVVIGVQDCASTSDTTRQQQWLAFSQRMNTSEPVEPSGASFIEFSQSDVSVC